MLNPPGEAKAGARTILLHHLETLHLFSQGKTKDGRVAVETSG